MHELLRITVYLRDEQKMSEHDIKILPKKPGDPKQPQICYSDCNSYLIKQQKMH